MTLDQIKEEIIKLKKEKNAVILAHYYEKGEIQVKDESVYDTLIDLANYAVMTAVEIRNNNKIIR